MKETLRFPPLARLLHWAMAVMILAMLFIGVYMAATSGPSYARLVAIHRPLGIAILALAIIRLINRLAVPTPPLPGDMPALMRCAAQASHMLLYALMIAMPLIGWGMLSAGGYPIPLWHGGLQLPPILPHDPALWAWLRTLHSWLAFFLFIVILGHLAAALFHGLIRRDQVVPSMVGCKQCCCAPEGENPGEISQNF